MYIKASKYSSISWRNVDLISIFQALKMATCRKTLLEEQEASLMICNSALANVYAKKGTFATRLRKSFKIKMRR